MESNAGDAGMDAGMDGLHGNRGMFRVRRMETTLVRPAAETYRGLYFLSNLDQNMAYMVELVFCFKGNGGKRRDNVSEVIKQALAKVLVHYYPLAGSLTLSSDGKLIVNCTGEGVPFAEAISDYEIEVLGDVTVLNEPSKLRNLVLSFDSATNVTELPLLTVQVTSFKCGGFVLGIGMNHCMTDLPTLMEFIHSWAEIARGLPLTILPSLDRSILRSRQPAKIEFAHHEFEKNEKVFNIQEEQLLYRSFSFNPGKMTLLKTKALEDGVINKCTNFTVLSAFLWRARTRALKMDPNQQTKLLIAVDVRSKLNPPLPKGYFFSGITFTCCLCTAGELTTKPLSFAVKLVQEAIELATEDYIRSAIDYFEITRGRTSIENTFMVSKWTGLPFYNADFSWGDPIKVGPATIKHNWAVFVPDGKESKNTIVSLCLPVSAMKIFQEMMQFNFILKSSI
ncbi:hypothetical protein HHK36_005839 [Tetracentron sinense]|uniref:Omega-hydroxypalmitate O-feruloyl transferase n=1 Tax=Tetracentron sinense TaxID=13715 RepID=A0A834ZLT6_TETSI|nr:hypothetical protein HHK36_005839 [Tetracentron sinense]